MEVLTGGSKKWLSILSFSFQKGCVYRYINILKEIANALRESINILKEIANALREGKDPIKENTIILSNTFKNHHNIT